MASRAWGISNQTKTVEEKKQELLQRLQQKKKEKDQQSPQPEPAKSNEHAASNSSMFTNDGSFLARFKAMQQNTNKNTTPSSQTSSNNRPALSIKMSTLRKPTTPKPTTSNLGDVFEKEDNIDVPPSEVQTPRPPPHVLMGSSTPGLPSTSRDGPSNSANPSGSVERKRKRKSRWGETTERGSSAAKSPAPLKVLDPAAIEAARIAASLALEHSIGMSQEEINERERQRKEQEEIQSVYFRILAKRAAAKAAASAKANKPKYEYDSDEEIDEEGTWEHKRRKMEMWKTAEEAKKLTEQAQGKHHIGDFLPPDELKKFIAKVKQVKGEKGLEDIDLSDYAEFKLTEDNIGYQMLKKAGWEEGKGLGSKGQGITAPIDKGRTPGEIGGLGEAPVGEIEEQDDEFEMYRKRMMLAYKFRPNPLNNPRRPYY
ncbi:predicted protein [Nematostella vectensis]|uniref:G-patch domain-containing protein n=1 Tax=Nematostella vectensis TaxID=45351 RepID=A7RS69_NEMVE|nr:SURP and G-patch domain-containing protein 1 [Nematostella vectensis]EDO45757.1 predicted protein [Nematostella vectensis]|eukprot:XP_001637820.1 predicted protein [Nematostella vectensis]